MVNINFAGISVNVQRCCRLVTLLMRDVRNSVATAFKDESMQLAR